MWTLRVLMQEIGAQMRHIVGIPGTIFTRILVEGVKYW